MTRRLAAEFIGTALLLAIVVGSGIMGERLAAGNTAIALLANTLATGAGLVVLIGTFGSISGAHFNPAVSAVEAAFGRLAWRELAPYAATQCLGAIAGVMAAHAMFELPVFSASRHARAGAAQAFSEVVATFGLVSVILHAAHRKATNTAMLVGAWITAAYWFTASTSFANPAVTLARSLSDTFAGIAPTSAPAFILAQLVGALMAAALFGWLLKTDTSR